MSPTGNESRVACTKRSPVSGSTVKAKLARNGFGDTMTLRLVRANPNGRPSMAAACETISRKTALLRYDAPNKRLSSDNSRSAEPVLARRHLDGLLELGRHLAQSLGHDA